MAQIYPLQILIASLAGWMTRRQTEVLEYLIEENRVGRQPIREPAASACSGAAACCLIRQAIVPFIARPGDQRAFRVQSVSRTGSESVRERLRNSVDHFTKADW